MKNFFKKIYFFFEKLSFRPKIGGLQISDSGIQFVLIEDDRPLTAAFRLPPGVIKNGVIQDKSVLTDLLRQLHKVIKPEKDSEQIRVIVSLPAELVYSQSFTVPNIDSSLINESAKLNLQMVSPLPPEKIYLSWQLINETPERYEFLGAVAERKVIDDFALVLKEANFLATAFEFPALSLARLVNQAVASSAKAILIIDISSDGLDLSLIRNGRLYFDHFRSWLSIQGESRQITKAAFEATVLEETGRVINFTFNRFKEQPEQVILIAPGFEKEIQDLLQSQFNLKVLPLTLRNFPSLGASWFTALGSALRGLVERSRDEEISLSPLSSVEEYYREQMLRFTILWRNIIIGVSLIFLFIFIGINIFLVNLYNQLQHQLESFKTQPVIQELDQLHQQARQFNQLVSAIEEVKTKEFHWSQFLRKLQTIANNYKISFNQLQINSPTQPIQLAARAPNSTLAIEFKNALARESNFMNVDLPLTSVTTLEDNSVSFSLTFLLRNQ